MFSGRSELGLSLDAIIPESGLSQKKNPDTQVMRAGALIYDPPEGGV